MNLRHLANPRGQHLAKPTAGLALLLALAGALLACGGGTGATNAGQGGGAASSAQASLLTWRGVSLAGAEFGESALPGTHGKDYIYPAVSSAAYFAGKGMNLMRLPFRWERLQQSPYAAFDNDELQRLKTWVDSVTATGVSVLLDPHNYARYHGQVLGSSALPHSTLADFWSRLAMEFKGNPRVLFGLMNEPHDMPTETWVQAANAAIAAIRATGALNTITVPGNAWSGAGSWSDSWYGTPNAVAMLKVSDPANQMLIEVHQYLDADSTGASTTCVSATIGSQRLAGFTTWLRQNGRRGLLGETGGANNSVCQQAVTDALNHLTAHADVWAGWVWWAAGPWWGDAFLSIEPTNGIDKPQMGWLAPFLR